MGKQPKSVSFCFDMGSSKYKEDGYFITDKYFGVFDGMSAAYSPSHPPILYNGLSGGEYLSRMIEENVLYNSCMDLTPLALLKRINLLIRSSILVSGVNLEESGEIPGATFAIANVNDDMVNIAQAGDCTAFVVNKDGSFFLSENQIYMHDVSANNELQRIMCQVAKEIGGEREKILGESWDRYYDFFYAKRKEDTNNKKSLNGFGLLNGQNGLFDFLVEKQFNVDDIKFLMLFTDGVTPWDMVKSMSREEIASRMMQLYKEGGAHKIVQSARNFESVNKNSSYVDYAEATIIVLEF